MYSSRRSFLFRFGIFLNGVAASLIGIPILGYLLAPVRTRALQAWIPLGDVDDYETGRTALAEYENPFTVPWDGETARIPCWVRREPGDVFSVFAINCTHLGCPVRWFEGSGLFMCPCHGGVYYADGTVASGPPPRPLYRYETEIRDGRLWVRGGRLPTLSESV